jgi:iron(III) transport system substrate-binding protein
MIDALMKYHAMKCGHFFSLTALAVGLSILTSTVFAAEVNVYSYRKPQLIDPMFEVFTQKTGIKVNSVYAKKGMLERLKQEGSNSPADLVFTVDIGRLTDIQKAGLTQAVQSDELERTIPAQFREPNGHWFGLTSRARIIVTSVDRVGADDLKTYEDLTDARWKGRICTRSGKHPYMVALTASMIAHYGIEKAKDWLTGLKANLARKPQGNDRAQVKAIKEGVCDVAVINHYYMAKMLKDPKQVSWAKAVRVMFPNQQDFRPLHRQGTHMNISGLALTKHAPNRDAAIALMEFLASAKGQRMYAQKNGEYPVTPGVEWNDLQKAWGPFKQDELALADIAKNRAAAIRMADEVGYNQ